MDIQQTVDIGRRVQQSEADYYEVLQQSQLYDGVEIEIEN